MTFDARQFWMDHELEKIRDANRRAFLRRMFSGEEGWRKFLTIMRTRTGADEFRTGEWQSKIPKFTKAELELKRRPCIYGCGFVLPPQFSPWGELFEDFIPICLKCLLKIENNKTQKMETQNSTTGSAPLAEVNPSNQPADSSHLSGVTLEEMVAQFQHLNPVGRIRLGEQIINETRKNMKKELAELEAKIKDLRGYIGENATVQQTGTIKRRVGRPRKIQNNPDVD